MQTGPNDFVVVWDNGHMAIKNHAEVSHMYDLSDCDYMDGVAGVYAVNEKNELVKVTLGKLERDADYDPEGSTMVYAYTAIFAGSRRVGSVAWTDH